MHFDAVKVHLAGGHRLTCALHLPEVSSVDWQWHNMRPYDDPVMRESKESFNVALFGKHPVMLFGLPDLTLLRR